MDTYRVYFLNQEKFIELICVARYNEVSLKNLYGRTRFILTKFNEDYELVGETFADNLEDVFYRFNTVEEYWWKHPQVKPFFEGGRRSMSVGDLALRMSDGVLFRVEDYGWEEFATIIPNADVLI